MKTAILLIAACAFIQSATAQVRKCTGADGRITFSDTVCAATTTKETAVAVHNNVVDGSEMRSQAQANRVTAAGDQAIYEKGGLCKFSYLALGDDLGRALAAEAKKECLENLRAKATSQPTSNDAYTRWKDHSSQKQASRNAAINQAANTDNARAIANSINGVSNAINNKTYECKPNMTGSALNCR